MKKKLKSEQVNILFRFLIFLNLNLDDLVWKHKQQGLFLCGGSGTLYPGSCPPVTCPMNHWEPVIRSPLEFYYIKIEFIPTVGCDKTDNSGKKCKFTTNKGGNHVDFRYHACIF